MELSAALLAVVLVSQATPAHSHGAPATGPARPTPSDLAAEGVLLPADSSGRYRPVDLTEVLNDAPRDPAQRLAAVQGYWRLWRAFAGRAIAETNLARLKPLARQIEAGTVEATLVAAEEAAAQAQLAEADLEVREAQVTLCGLLGWNASGSMPRPLDPPHVRTYNTYYESIYQRRTPTERVLLIHQTLPIYHAALGARGTARQAALDMVAAQEKGFQQQQINVETLLAAWQAQSREQQELCRLAHLYNELIAEYAVPLAGQNMETPKLVGMLIRHGGSTASRRNPRAELSNPLDTNVEQADFTEAAPEPAPLTPGELEDQPQQTPQAWPPSNEYSNDATSTTAEESSDADQQDTGVSNGAEVEPDAAEPVDENGVYQDDAPADDPSRDPFPAYNGARYERSVRKRFAAKLVVETANAPIFAGVSATNATPRALIEKMLPRTYIGDQGETRLPLSKCLGAVSPTRYADLLDAYVAAWQAASNYQADADSLAQTQAVQAALLKRLADPNVPHDMLVLRAAELSYLARMIEDEAEIWQSMKQLGTIALPRQADARALPIDEPPVWAAAAGTPAEAALAAKGRGMVAVDAARSQACRETANVAGLTGLTMQAIERQNEETRGFIDQTARAARENGTAVLARLGSNATASAVHRALLGTSTSTATRPATGSQYRP